MVETDQASVVEAPAAASILQVSGRYDGQMTLPHPGRFVMDLRVDIDSATPNSPTTNRISGDLYQVFRSGIPGVQPAISKTYIESWIVDDPQITWSSDHVDIEGNVRYWAGTHPATKIALRIGRDGSQPTHTASVTLTESGVGQRGFTCQRVSKYFRGLDLEIDVCSSVNAAPLLPSYDTHWHNDRPVDLPARLLTIKSAYQEIGVDVTIDPSHTMIDDSAESTTVSCPAPHSRRASETLNRRHA